MASYQDLLAWQQAVDLVASAYRATRAWPKDELYGLTAQVRRAATSVPANIAEGYGREHRRSYVHFLRIAQGSLKELETHLIVSKRIEIATEETIAPLLAQCASVGKLLRLLIRKLEPSPDE
ncbi:MAG: four helix bundle protein [Pseudomonadota bacterium]